VETGEFIEFVDSAEKNTLAIDFDGVIHDNNKGFYDGTVYGEPIVGSLEAIKDLANDYKIIIYTCKANPHRPLVNNKTGVELVWEWLKKYQIDSCVLDVTFEKPNALAYIDDKAIRFESWDDTKEVLKLNKLAR